MSAPTSVSDVDQLPSFVLIEEPGLQQRPDVRDRRLDVLRGETDVVVQRPAQRVCFGAGGAENRPAHSGDSGPLLTRPSCPWVADHTLERQAVQAARTPWHRLWSNASPLP